MTRKTQEWAERVGREAVELGFRWRTGMSDLQTELVCVGFWGLGESAVPSFAGDPDCGEQSISDPLPDFRDRLTELACIAWVEDVARDVRPQGDFDVQFYPDGSAQVTIWWHEVEGSKPLCVCDASTLAEACIAAVRAMKGGE